MDADAAGERRTIYHRTLEPEAGAANYRLLRLVGDVSLMKLTGEALIRVGNGRLPPG